MSIGIQRLPAGMLTTGVIRKTEDDDLCNDLDESAMEQLERNPRCKFVWHIRHGQSTGNVAKLAAWAADDGTGKSDHFDSYRESLSHVDARLTEQGCQEARNAAGRIRPELVVCSVLTRAIQTAAIMFEDLLRTGEVKLVIRPELREFWEV